MGLSKRSVAELAARHHDDLRIGRSVVTKRIVEAEHRAAHQSHRTETSHPTAAMPTPESASFQAAKPTVPPTFDGVDYDDNKALKAAQDSIIREQWVQSMMARLIREEMGKCYYREGVNHLEKCGKLRGGLYGYEMWRVIEGLVC